MVLLCWPIISHTCKDILGTSSLLSRMVLPYQFCVVLILAFASLPFPPISLPSSSCFILYSFTSLLKLLPTRFVPWWHIFLFVWIPLNRRVYFCQLLYIPYNPVCTERIVLNIFHFYRLLIHFQNQVNHTK